MSSKYSVRQSVATVAALCLISEFSFGQVNCQNGLDYKNSCNPYKIKFIKVPKSSKDDNLHQISKKDNNHYKPKSYLDALLQRYSSNYNGNYGLQSVIDRSGYHNINPQKEQTKEQKVAKKSSEKKGHLKQGQKSSNKEHIAQKADTKRVKKEEITKNSISIKKQTTLQKDTNKKVAKKELASKNKKDQKLVSKEVQKKVVKKSIKLATNSKLNKKEISKKYKLYTIKEGDSLSVIAKKFNIKIDKLKELNSFDKNNTVRIGQKLKLPANAKLNRDIEAQLNKRYIDKLAKKVNKTKKVEPTKTNKEFYVVKKGDTLSLIAKKSGLSITKLREYNRLARSSKIKVGDTLYLKPIKLAKRESRSFDFTKNIKFKKSPSLKFKKKIRVVATAYTSHVEQTDSTPFIAAWNNRIRPGMKIIAVSHDLIKKYGLTNGVKVKITGLPGYYTVRDKMNKRLKNHIDIYMGLNKRKALRWGRRRIVLYW